MVKSVVVEFEDEQGDVIMSGNEEILDVEFDFVSKDCEVFVDLYVYLIRKNYICRKNLF